MHNVEPGPLLFQNAPQVFWTYIAALYIGNVVLLFLNLPLVGIFARVATIRPVILMPVVSTICLLGVYCSRNNMFDVWVMVIAGVIGVFFRIWKYPVAPLVVGLILGPMAENSFRKTLLMFHGSLVPMLERPIALTILAAAAVFIIAKVVYYVVRRRSAAA